MAETPVRTFNVRLTDEEMAKITAKAKELGLSKAGLIRRLLERAGLIAPSAKGTGGKKPAPPPQHPQVKPNFKKGMTE
jgi:hypothetical protein